MLTLFTLIGLLFGQTGVRLDAYIPAQERVVTGRIAGVGDEVVVVTQGRLFVGQVSLLVIERNRAYIEANGWQDGIEAYALMEFEDNPKRDLGYIVIVQVIGEGGFGLPGRGSAAYPTRPGGQAVEIFGGEK